MGSLGVRLPRSKMLPLRMPGLILWLSPWRTVGTDNAEPTFGNSPSLRNFGSARASWAGVTDRNGAFRWRDASNGVNGKAGMMADAVFNNYGKVNLPTLNVAVRAFTLFVVWRSTGGSLNTWALCGIRDAVNGRVCAPQLDAGVGQATILVARGVNISGKRRTAGAIPRDNVARIMRYQYDGTHVGHRLWLDGVEQAMTDEGGVANPGLTASDAATGAFLIGTYQDTLNHAYSVFGDILLYEGVAPLSDANAVAVERWLGSLYSIAIP